ncbi:MAG: hypothetical protein Q9169_002152 [Polycauliona sp. 2 TL-2023]
MFVINSSHLEFSEIDQATSHPFRDLVVSTQHYWAVNSGLPLGQGDPHHHDQKRLRLATHMHRTSGQRTFTCPFSTLQSGKRLFPNPSSLVILRLTNILFTSSHSTLVLSTSVFNTLFESPTTIKSLKVTTLSSMAKRTTSAPPLKPDKVTGAWEDPIYELGDENTQHDVPPSYTHSENDALVYEVQEDEQDEGAPVEHAYVCASSDNSSYEDDYAGGPEYRTPDTRDTSCHRPNAPSHESDYKVTRPESSLSVAASVLPVRSRARGAHNGHGPIIIDGSVIRPSERPKPVVKPDFYRGRNSMRQNNYTPNSGPYGTYQPQGPGQSRYASGVSYQMQPSHGQQQFQAQHQTQFQPSDQSFVQASNPTYGVPPTFPYPHYDNPSPFVITDFHCFHAVMICSPFEEEIIYQELSSSPVWLRQVSALDQPFWELNAFCRMNELFGLQIPLQAREYKLSRREEPAAATHLQTSDQTMGVMPTDYNSQLRKR